MPTVGWDPAQYDRFADERSRPFADLVARIRTVAPERVIDLGCGTGALTATLCDRWPHADVLGIDNDPSMLRAAATHTGPRRPRLRFEHGDLATWLPEAPVDVVVTNAALQWLPGHLALIAPLIANIRPGGAFAMQVPGNFDDPHHQSIREVMARPRWRGPLSQVPERTLSSYPATVYLSALRSMGCEVDAWETTYVHVLDPAPAAGSCPVLEWVKGTALRPILSALSISQAAEFCDELDELLRPRFGSYSWGTPFPFRRVFAVAHRPA